MAAAGGDRLSAVVIALTGRARRVTFTVSRGRR
jgi:hypothetical protein